MSDKEAAWDGLAPEQFPTACEMRDRYVQAKTIGIMEANEDSDATDVEFLVASLAQINNGLWKAIATLAVRVDELRNRLEH